MMVFEDEAIDRTCNKWKAALLGKFIRKGLPIDFVQNELRIG